MIVVFHMLASKGTRIASAADSTPGRAAARSRKVRRKTAASSSL